MEALLKILQEAPGWAVVEQGQNLVIPLGTRRIMNVFLRSLKDDMDIILVEPLERDDGYWVPERVCVFPSYTRVARKDG